MIEKKERVGETPGERPTYRYGRVYDAKLKMDNLMKDSPEGHKIKSFLWFVHTHIIDAYNISENGAINNVSTIVGLSEGDENFAKQLKIGITALEDNERDYHNLFNELPGLALEKFKSETNSPAIR